MLGLFCVSATLNRTGCIPPRLCTFLSDLKVFIRSLSWAAFQFAPLFPCGRFWSSAFRLSSSAFFILLMLFCPYTNFTGQSFFWQLLRFPWSSSLWNLSFPGYFSPSLASLSGCCCILDKLHLFCVHFLLELYSHFHPLFILFPFFLHLLLSPLHY